MHRGGESWNVLSFEKEKKKRRGEKVELKGWSFFFAACALCEITFNENDTNVLIFLDTTNDKRFKKNVSSKAIDPVPLCTYFSLYRARD